MTTVIRKVIVCCIQLSLAYNATRNLLPSSICEWIIVSKSEKSCHPYFCSSIKNLQIILSISVRSDPSVDTEIVNIFTIMICSAFNHWLRSKKVNKPWIWVIVNDSPIVWKTATSGSKALTDVIVTVTNPKGFPSWRTWWELKRRNQYQIDNDKMKSNLVSLWVKIHDVGGYFTDGTSTNSRFKFILSICFTHEPIRIDRKSTWMRLHQWHNLEIFNTGTRWTFKTNH